jgi:pimeloyl-ACP methyl ester carboxylesterase
MHTIPLQAPRQHATAAHDAAAVRHLARPGGAIAFEDAGDGPPVVMLPGLGDLRQQYRFLAPDIGAAGYRAVSADLRGHGASSTGWSDYGSEAAGGDLIALIEALGADPAVVIGTSFGAAPAVYAAAERPDLVAGLVLIGPFVRRQHMSALMRGALRLMTAGPWKVRAWGAFYDTLYPSAKPADHREHRHALLANLAEPGRFDALRGMLFRDDTAIEARLAAVRAPTLVVMGTKDPDFADPAAEARAVADAVSGEVAMIDGAGHYPHVEMPEATNATIARFVRAAHGDAPHAAR